MYPPSASTTCCKRLEIKFSTNITKFIPVDSCGGSRIPALGTLPTTAVWTPWKINWSKKGLKYPNESFLTPVEYFRISCSKLSMLREVTSNEMLFFLNSILLLNAFQLLWLENFHLSPKYVSAENSVPIFIEHPVYIWPILPFITIKN